MVLIKKSEKNKKGKVMMSELALPDELVLSSILPLLSMKDVARSSLVSHSWLRYWHHTPLLTFDDPSGLDTTMNNALNHLSTYFDVISDARTSFIIWVNNILTNHIGCTLEQFKLVYYLNHEHQLIIDSRLVWAFSEHVKTLLLDFTAPLATYGYVDPEKYYYVLDRTLLHSSNTAQLYLTTLCLKSVNVDTLTLNYLLNDCASTLDNLCIVKSHYLTSITSVSLPSLKYFMVDDCPKLDTIDIKAPKLVSFTYDHSLYTYLSVFNIENASKLCYVNLIVSLEERLLFMLRSLFKYFSHLDHLKLQWHADRRNNLVLDKFPVLANLKQLEWCVFASDHQTLASWVPFIGACPRLEKLTLEIRGQLSAVPPKDIYQDKCPLRCLKTFEIRGVHGCNLDIDIANFVVENGINLQEVILHPCKLFRPLNLEAPFAGVDFELPPHVKLVIVSDSVSLEFR